MSKTFYHGTTAEAAAQIMKEGFDAGVTVWNCSDNTKTYLSGAADEFDENEGREAFYTALEAAQIAAAVQKSDFDYVVVFHFVMPDDVAEEYVEQDDSTSNSYHYQIEEEALNQLVSSGKIQVSALKLDKGYNKDYRLLYLSSVASNEYLNGCAIEDEILKVARILTKFDDLQCYVFDELIDQYEDCKEFWSNEDQLAVSNWKC